MPLHGRVLSSPARSLPLPGAAGATLAACGAWLVGWFVGGCCASTAWASDAHAGRLCQLSDGRQLHYAEYGDPDGALVLYFHGTPGSHHEVGLIHDELEASQLRLVSVNRPGMGRSTFDPDRRMVDWPHDVEQLVAAVAEPSAPFGVIGFSGGAAYALACARAFPDRVTHLALVSGHAPPGAHATPGSQDEAIAWMRRRPVLGEGLIGLFACRLETHPARVVQRVSQTWSPADRRLVLNDPQLKRRLLENLREAVHCGPEGVARDIVLLGSCWGFAPSEARAVPASVWQGGCDPIATPSMGRYFHRCLPRSTWHFDPAGGHVTTFKNNVPGILAQFQRRAETPFVGASPSIGVETAGPSRPVRAATLPAVAARSVE